MSNYIIYIGGYEYPVSGTEAAYELYRKGCEFATLCGKRAYLVDGETGEILKESEG